MTPPPRAAAAAGGRVLPGGLHPRRDRRPLPVLHQHHRARLRPGQPPRGGQGRAVRPLQPDHPLAAAPVPRRVLRRPRARHRPPGGGAGGRRGGAPGPRRGPLRAGLHRVRRRLRGPAGLRPPRLRAGLQRAHQGAGARPPRLLPGAEHPLPALRPAPRRALPLPRPARGGRLASGGRLPGDPRRAVRHLLPPVGRLEDHYRRRYPPDGGDGDAAYRASLQARACDDLRGLLPAATISHLGIHASGQAYEALLLRMRAHPLAEARDYAGRMLVELRRVIPAFLRRVDRPDRGGAWSRYLADTARAMEAERPHSPRPRSPGPRSPWSTGMPTPRPRWPPPPSTRTPTSPTTSCCATPGPCPPARWPA